MAFAGIAPPDPFALYDTSFYQGTFGHRQTAGLTVRSATINSGLKNLVLLVCGQSLLCSCNPTLYTPSNSTKVDQLNVYDGQLYSIGGPVLGCTYSPVPANPGNASVRVADNLVTNNKFDRVILANVTIGGTFASQWEPSGIHGNRANVAMRRLASLGITPGMTGVTFAAIYSIGESDFSFGTAQNAFAASAGNFITNLRGTGFNGRIFVTTESGAGQTSNVIRTAQASLLNGTTIFSAGDLDSNSIARVDGVHFSDAGAATAASLIVTAMANSGAPF